MASKLQEFISGELGIRLAFLIGWVFPERIGYPLADFIADRIASRRNIMIVRGVRGNQRIVRGLPAESEALDRAVRETIRNSARSIFDLYRGLQHPRAALDLISCDPAARELTQRPEFGGRGLVLASLHLGNFDLILHLLSLKGFKPLIITIPNPRGGRRMEFESRRRSGANLIPASVAGLRQAVRHLRQGGLVATGIDRPIPDPEIRPRFFGLPSALPVHHIFLALKAKVPIVMLVTRRRPDGSQWITASDPIEMEPHPDRDLEIQRNAEKILLLAEELIREVPAQWSVSLPVWPEFPEPLTRPPR